MVVQCVCVVKIRYSTYIEKCKKEGSVWKEGKEAVSMVCAFLICFFCFLVSSAFVFLACLCFCLCFFSPLFLLL